MKNLILIIMSLLFVKTAFAEGKEIKIAVKGMVCGFCAQGITKKFNAESSISKVDVSLEKKSVVLDLKDGKDLSDKTITDLLTEAGYKVEKIER